jgi:putative flavoprotein involved in K+ transport
MTDMAATTVDAEPSEVAAAWLQRLEGALCAQDAEAARALFLADGWWRDALAISWDLRTFHGGDQLLGAIRDRAIPAGLGGTALVEGRPPVRSQPDPATAMVQAFFEFRTVVGRGRGVARLVAGDAGWQAAVLFTSLTELGGHAQQIGRNRRKGTRHRAQSGRVTWKDHRAREREFFDSEPYVVVVGAGQAGLALAARLRVLGVATLVIERNGRVGDNWRARYPGLVLHDPVWYDHLPYLPFPESWPVFTPKDKLADWLEGYAAFMELDVWTSTTLLDAGYDDAEGRWRVRVRRGDGAERELRPGHVVLATGTGGDPLVPEVPGLEEFAGEVTHSSTFAGGRLWTGRDAVVVGAGNSGLDVAQDLHESGANVTVVQRSGTYVMSSEHGVARLIGTLYHEGGPATEDADMLVWSVPNRLAAAQLKGVIDELTELDAEMLQGLERAGFAVDFGDGSGMFSKYMERAGGYYIDVGCAALIADGEVKVEQGRGLDRFTPTGVALDDGTTLDADVVVMATGYKNMRETARRVLGDAAADRCGPVWGLDEEGELRGVWRPTGHPSLWFAAGNLAQVRFFSLPLALQLKAREVGLVS